VIAVQTLSLHTRLTLWLAALLSVVALALVVAITHISERYRAETTQRLNAGVAMYVTNELALIDANGINETALRELAHRAMTVNPSVEIYLLAPNGQILTTLVDQTRLVRNEVDLRPVKRFLAGNLQGPLFGDDPTSTTARSVFTVAEIRTRGVLSGYLYVVLASQRYASIASAVSGNYSLKIALLALAAVLSLTLLAGSILFRRLTLPLRQLQARLDTWSRQMGLKGIENPAKDADEIHALTSHFASLSQRITDQMHDIAARDTQRRELIAGVSHDLRTPLAALHGYLEAVLMKDGTLDPRKRHDYLSTAHRHAMQLEHLIAALFQLSKLEAGLVSLNRESFSIAELLCDVALRFQLRAEQKRVRLAANVTGENAIVTGDIALIERALANLIDNALRHTPEGGEIALSMRSQDAKATIAVTDTGCGMSTYNESDTRHRFDNSTKQTIDRGPGDSAGLGLAIVRRIVQLHGSELRIHSAVGQGTRIDFELALSRPALSECRTPGKGTEESASSLNCAADVIDT